MGHTYEELDSAALRDLLSDAEQSEKQAANGPFYPERGITPESLRAYAKKCREKIERYRDGGANDAIIRGL